MDIEKEITNHLLWIEAIASLLDSEELADEDIQQITRHDQCSLGQWLNSDAAHAFRELPEFRKLLESHEEFHELAAKLIVSLQKGRDAEATKAHGQFIRMSQEVIGYLQVLRTYTGEN
mgnify:CR=1 FL=1